MQGSGREYIDEYQATTARRRLSGDRFISNHEIDSIPDSGIEFQRPPALFPMILASWSGCVIGVLFSGCFLEALVLFSIFALGGCVGWVIRGVAP